MKKIYIMVLLLLACITLKSQTNLNTVLTGVQTYQYQITPLGYVLLSAGFEYSPQGTNYFSVNTVTTPPVVLPPAYNPVFIDPETRTLDTNLPVGSTAGRASVSLTGGATYSIPIFAPPGTAGMQPNVSLVYSSQSGNGIAGYGWNISGLSAITRVPHTIYHDGDVKGVNFVDDRFALDGQRIINVTGSYGADLTTYYTEVFNGSKIVSHIGLSGTLEWFEVFNKDGSVVEYGRTDDSRFKSQLTNQATVSWNIDKITDANGNYIQFIYHRGDIECYLTEIKYTGNDSDINSPIVPYNSIKFYYSERVDKSTVFVGGSRIDNNVILDHVDILAENKLFKSYKLKYFFDFHSKLNEVAEYRMGSAGDSTKYNSTVFGYGNKSELFTHEFSDLDLGEQVDIIPGDFNGDGYGDFIAAHYEWINPDHGLPWVKKHTYFKIYTKDPNLDNNNFILKKTESLPYGNSNFILSFPNLRNFIPSDVNGDGRSDFVMAQTTQESYGPKLQQLKYYISTDIDTSFNIMTRSPQYEYSRIKGPIYTGDFNGDGKSDQLAILGDSTGYFPFVFWGDETGTCSSLSYEGSPHIDATTWKDADKIYVQDFNGDGKSEIMVIKGSICNIFNFKKSAGGSLALEEIYYSGFPTKWHWLEFGDFNGDGKTDILCRSAPSTTLGLSGSGFM